MAVKGIGKVIYKWTGSIRGPFGVFASGRRHKLDPDMDGYFYIEKAESPSEILFIHMGYSSVKRFIRKMASLICTLIMIGGTFTIIFLLKGTESNLKQTGTDKTSGNQYLILITVLIKLACIVLELVTPFLVEFEKPETVTLRNIGRIWRSTTSVFLNSAVVVTLANVYYQGTDLDATFYTDNGLANDLLYLQLFAGLEAVFSVFVPGYIPTLLKRIWLEKFWNKTSTFQMDANKAFEGMPFVYPARFGKYCNLILLTFFQISIFPIHR